MVPHRFQKKIKKAEPFVELSPQQRLVMIERVVKFGDEISQVCLDYHISRPNFYKWLKRYREAAEEKALEAMKDKTPKIERYYKQTPELYEQAVLEAVSLHPQFGVERIVKVLPVVAGKPIVGYHGVQKILERNNLNTYEKRLTFTQAQITPVTRLIAVFEALGTRFIVLPVVIRARIIKFVGAALLTAFITTVAFGFLGYMTTMVTGVPISARVGLGFATVSLFVGSFFFAYSMKYYLTLALVLSFSRQPVEEGGFSVGLNGKFNGNHYGKNGNVGWLRKIFGLENGNGNSNGKNGKVIQAGGLQPSLDHIKLKRYPFVSIHLPFYNEKKVAERILSACTSMDYPNYEVIVCDDSTDETVQIVQKYAKEHNRENPHGPKIKILHRLTREGFKGGALNYAAQNMDPRTEFCVVFDADFIPYPDTLEMFVKYFKVNNNGSENYQKNNIAAVGGYQWHVLNKSENWITRGVRTEYAGSYVIERPGQEILGLLKQISGSVYMIRTDVLKKVGWGKSITEDFQLTLKLYEQGYKVVYTPYVQAPSECVSTLKRLIRQRMRWAEGHSHCIKQMFVKLMTSSRLTLMEKLEVLYISPYYLQAAFFLIGTFCWLMAETVFGARLPFWTSLWGWSLVLTNFFALPLVNAVGLFLEESEEKDYLGILSFVALSYIVVPFQAYASVKGFIEKQEGPWFRTPKTGRITDIFTRGKFYRWVAGILPGKRGTPAYAESRANERLAWLNNPHVALATANNRFDSFSIRPGKSRWVGKFAIFLVVGASILLSYFGNKIPQGAIIALPIKARVEVQRQDYSLLAQAANIFKPREVFAQSFVAEKFFDSKIISEAKGTILVLFLLLSLGFFISLVRRKRRFITSVVRPLFIFLLVVSWLLASWPGLPLINFPPKIHEVQAAVPVVDSGYTSNTLVTTTVLTLTLTKPSGVQTGDLLLIIVGNDDSTATAQWDDATLKPTGFTLINEAGNATPDCHTAAFYRVADGNEGDTVDVTAQSADDYYGYYIRVTGVNTTNPINAVGSDINQTAATSVNITGVDTNVDDALAFYTACFDGGDGEPFTATGTGWSKTTEIEAGSGTGNAGGSWGTKEQASLGATGTVNVDATGTASDGWAGFQFAVAPSNAPSAPIFYNEDGGSNQIAFDNIRQNDATPIVRASATYTSTFNRFQVEFNTASNFGGTSYTETFSGTYSSGTAYNLQTTVSLNLPSTDGVTYYVRAKASADGGTNYGSWSSGTWTYTYTSSAGDPEWFQTTDEQFDTGTLSSTATTGSDSVEIGGGTTEYVRANATAGSLSTTLDIGTAGTNRLVAVFASSEADSATALSGVTVDGKSCNVVQSALNSDSLGNRTELWYCDESDLGSSNGSVTVAISGTGLTAANWAVHAQLFTGVSQDGPTDYGTDTTSITPTTTTTVTGMDVLAGGIVVMGVSNGTQALTATWPSPLTQKSDADPSSADEVTASGIETSAQTNKTYQVTWSSAPNRSSAVAASWAPISASSGTIMSTEIDFDWFDNATAWNDVYWSEDEAGGTIKIQVYYNNCGTIIPDGDFSGCSASNNSTGFTTGPIDVSCLSTTTYNEICLKATLDAGSGTPYLQDWGVSVPENPLLLFGFGSFVLGYIKKMRRKKI